MKGDIPILMLKDIKVNRSGVNVLDISTLNIKEGEVVSLIGPNGAGKSTLLMALCFLFKDFSGSIFFKGLEVGKDIIPFEYRRYISMVFQEPLLFNLTVYENVTSGLKFRKKSQKETKETVMKALERFGISHLKDRPARRLSGGEAQRVSLARALAFSPEVLFLDEPFSSLDVPTKESIIKDLEVAIRDSKVTTIFATHDREEALRLSDRIIVINNGKIIQEGAPYEVMNYPCNEFVASFVGVETILSGTVVKNGEGILSIDVSGSIIEAVGDSAVGKGVTLCIKPEDIILYPIGQDTQSSARNTFIGRVARIVQSNFYKKVYIDCGFPLVSVITNASAASLNLSEGKKIKASFKATSVHVIKG